MQWAVEERIGWLKIGRPPANAMTMQFFSAFGQWIDHVAADPMLKAIIILGNGRHFSSGADLHELLENSSETGLIENSRNFARLGQLKIPVIAAIRGVCLGSAFELALSCHFRICAEDAVLGLPEATYNLMPGIGGIGRMAKLAGKARGIELILRGATFPPAEALEMDLVDAVVPKKDLCQAADDFARALPENMIPGYRKLYVKKYLSKPNVVA
ncbi:MAG: enoyl-CoA hydratase/isomerase family protein [Bacteroidota bacterium]